MSLAHAKVASTPGNALSIGLGRPGDEATLARRTAAIVAGLLLMRLVAALYTPLMCDEAYYWMWSNHLAGGYYDHPPMVALVIRLGTMIAGDTELGVRLVSILLALPMSWAVYRTAQILFRDARVAATSAIMLNVTMMVAIGTMIITPDVPLMVASSFILFFLAKVLETGRGPWWLAVGAATGAALLSKYNALFFGGVMLIWLIAVPGLRRWLISPWPYLGGLVALAIFSPVILWNADHQWLSFLKQFGRALPDEFKPKFLAALIPGQFAFATPAVFLLGVSGLYALLKGYAGTRAASVLINATVWVVFAYFAVHSLHHEVHPDWLSQIYPALAIAAGVGAHLVIWRPRWQRVLDWLVRWALPGSILTVVLVIFQTNTGMLSGYRNDQVAHIFAVGFPKAAQEIEAIRARTGAGCILASDYGTTAWLAFYQPGICVAQYNERIRWVNMPEPDPALLKGKLLFVVTDVPAERFAMHTHFNSVSTVANLARYRGPTPIQTYQLVLLEGAKGEVFDQTPPRELMPR
jgi:hypothetical protein